MKREKGETITTTKWWSVVASSEDCNQVQSNELFDQYERLRNIHRNTTGVGRDIG